MPKPYRSRIMAAIHETAEDLHAAGLLDKRTMREFDESCLTPVPPLRPEEIRDLRERGEKHPRGASRKLLTLIARNGLEAVA